MEAIKILPLLTRPENGQTFHVVAPSLPNFGFSEAVKKSGFHLHHYVEVMHQLMMKLGYSKYGTEFHAAASQTWLTKIAKILVTQGGDWGAMVTRLLGAKYQKHCLASHINFVLLNGPPTFTRAPLLYLRHALTRYTNANKEGLARTSWFKSEGFGYYLQQSTKPSTLGFALADSPVALLAWIYEKLHDWTDSYPWEDDEILTWISIYQFSKAGPAASVRIYYEATRALDPSALDMYIPHVPLGISVFPKDVSVPPTFWAHTLGPVVFEASHDRGGHFAAYECPEQLAQDLKEMFSRDSRAYQVAREFY